jgi:hypothetical protein
MIYLPFLRALGSIFSFGPAHNSAKVFLVADDFTCNGKKGMSLIHGDATYFERKVHYGRCN